MQANMQGEHWWQAKRVILFRWQSSRSPITPKLIYDVCTNQQRTLRRPPSNGPAGQLAFAFCHVNLQLLVQQTLRSSKGLSCTSGIVHLEKHVSLKIFRRKVPGCIMKANQNKAVLAASSTDSIDPSRCGLRHRRLTQREGAASRPQVTEAQSYQQMHSCKHRLVLLFLAQRCKDTFFSSHRLGARPWLPWPR